MFKKILIGIVVIVVLLLGAMVAIPLIFKDEIIALAKEQIDNYVDADVAFSDMSVSLFRDFPNLALSIEDITVVNRAPFAGDTLADIGEVAVSLDIISVIKGEQIVVKGFYLVDPTLNVKVLKDGKANYDIMKESDAPAEETPEAESSTALNVSLQDYGISNANITYDDKAGNMYAKIVKLDHSGSGNFDLDVFDLNTETAIEAITVIMEDVSYLNKTSIKADLDLGIDLPNNTYTFKENSIQVNALKLSFNGKVALPDSNTTDLDVTFDAPKTQFKDILSLIPTIYAKDFDDIKADGTIALNGYVKGKLVGESYPAFAVNLSVANANFQYPDLPVGVNDINITASAKSGGGDLDKMVIDVPKFSMKAGSDPFNMTLNVRTPISDPNLDASLSGKLDLANVKNFYAMAEGEDMSGLISLDVTAKGRLSDIEKERYSKFDAKGSIQFTSLKYNSADVPVPVSVPTLKMTFSPQYVSIDALEAKLGKSDMSGKGRVDNLLNYLLADDVLKGSLTVNSELIDLNEFMAEGEGTTTTTNEETGEQEVETGANVPAGIDFTLTANMKKVVYDNMDLTNVAGKIIIRDESVRISGLRANLLSGKIGIDGTYSTKNTTKPQLNFKMNIDQIGVQEAFKTFNTVEKIAPIADNIQGKFSTNFDMTGELGDDLSPDMSTLLANGRVDLNQAKLSGNKVLNELADKLKIPSLKNVDIPAFWTILEVTDGKVFVEPFDITVQNIKMNIMGAHGLDNTMDYNIIMDVPSELLGPANQLVGNLLSQSPIPGLNANSLPKDVKFKVNLKGETTKPKMSISIVGAGGGSYKDAAMDALKKQQEEAERKIKEELDAQRKKAEEEAKRQMDAAKKKAEEEAKRKQKELEDAAKKKAEEEANKFKDKIKWP